MNNNEATARRLDKGSLLNSNAFVMGIVLIVIIAIFSFMNANYFTYNNFVNILNAAAIVGMLAIGETYLIIAGHIDLSSGNTAALFGVIIALLLKNTEMAWPLVMILTLACSALIGLANAALVNIFELQPFIATLAMSSVCRGAAYLFADGKAVPISNNGFIQIGVGSVLGVPVPAIIAIVLFIVFGFILARTVFGRSVYMVGGNETAARLAGLRPKKISTILYVISSCIAALAGIVVAGRMHSGQPGAISGSEFDAITAAVLGGVAFSGGTGNLGGCFLGLIIIQCFATGLTVVNVSSFWQILAKGLLLVAALIFDYFRRKRLAKA